MLGIDLNLIGHFDAASLAASWIKLQKVQVLNVAGPRASKDNQIYSDVVIILEQVAKILTDEERKSKVELKQPETVDEAVERLVTELSLKVKTAIANMAEEDLIDLHLSLGLSIRNRFLYPRNERLLESCRHVAKDKYLHWDQAGRLILKHLWRRLQEIHKLRVVK